jgi:nucleoside-diphosphate-sugar epimerase
MSRIVAMTGATGFAGQHAVAELEARGCRMRALVRQPGKAGLPASVDIVTGDLSDPHALRDLLTGADAVIHLAGALTGLAAQDYFSVNQLGTEALMVQALALGTPRFVHVSSLAAREPQLSLYAASKRAGEEAVRARMDDLNAIIIRPPAVYGPGDRGTLPLITELTRPIAAIPSSPAARFSLIHGRDLARLIAQALDSDARGLHEVSDGKPDGYGWADLIAVASAFRGSPVRPLYLPRALPAAVAWGAEGIARLRGRPGMVNRGKIAELYHPDWVSRVGTLALSDPLPFERGFPETVNWYRAAGWLPRGPSADRSSQSSGKS